MCRVDEPLAANLSHLPGEPAGVESRSLECSQFVAESPEPIHDNHGRFHFIPEQIRAKTITG